MEKQRLPKSRKTTTLNGKQMTCWKGEEMSSLKPKWEGSKFSELESANSSKKRKMESPSSSLMESSETSTEEASQSSSDSTAGQILQDMEALKRQVVAQGEQIGMILTLVPFSLIARLMEVKYSPLNGSAVVFSPITTEKPFGQRVMGVVKKGDNKGRLFYANKGDDDKLKNFKMLPVGAKLASVAHPVHGEKEKADGRRVRWTSWKDNEEDQFVMGTYEEVAL